MDEKTEALKGGGTKSSHQECLTPKSKSTTMLGFLSLPLPRPGIGQITWSWKHFKFFYLEVEEMQIGPWGDM